MTSKSGHSSEFAAIDEVAAQFGVTTRTIQRWVAAGQFPQPLRFSLRVLLWHRETIQNFVNQKAAEAAKDTI